MLTTDLSREQLIALLEAHREEYLSTISEFFPVTSAEAEQALRDFEQESLVARRV